MESERDEELRVLFAAAEKGRADIINTVVEALAAKPKGAAAAGAYPYLSHSTTHCCVCFPFTAV